jgi:2-polyprenyl-3-methyl-5-hydroxy-6-metoxy-1,4-benzoquinol methylase
VADRDGGEGNEGGKRFEARSRTQEVAAQREPRVSCVVCGEAEAAVRYAATDRLYRTTDREFRIVQCGRCGLLRLSPQPTASELAAYYPDDYWFTPDAGSVSRLEERYRRFVLQDHVRFARRALAAAPAGGLVVDVGCGGGLFLRMLAERGHRVVGLDAGEAAARAAWRVNRVPAVRARLSDAPFPAHSCSAVTMFHVLEHVADPAAYLEQARELLGPGGRLIVQVPNASSWQFALLGSRWSGLDVPRHLWDFRPRDLEALLTRAGLEIVRAKHFSLRDNPAGLATSIAPGLDPMARRIRRTVETPAARLCKDLLYLGLVAASLPFALCEAACRAGSTIMIEARARR